MRPLACTLMTLLIGAFLLVSGCGGDSAKDILKDTFGGKKNVKSGRLDIGLTINAQGGQAAASGPITIKLSGPFQSQGDRQLPKFDLSASLTGGGQTRSAGAVTTGDKGFIRVQDDVYAVPPAIFNQFKQGFEQAQAQSSRNENQTSLGALGVDPLKWLKDPKVEDDETIGGVDSKHVSAGVDEGKFLDDVNKLLSRARRGSQGSQLPTQGITPQQKQQVEDAIKNARFDVWSGKDDKVLRKMALTLDFDLPRAQQSAGGLQKGSLTFTITLTELNKPQTIVEPANPKPFSELTDRLKGLLGGLGAGGGGGTGTPGGGTGGSGGGPSPRTQEYIDCIRKAGGNVEEAQKCARLLNP